MGPEWRLTDESIEHSRRQCLDQFNREQDLWVFAYGSLMWDPAFHFEEIRLAAIQGYKRRFTLKGEVGRGSPGRPALMLCLEPGDGECVGLAFRVAAARAEHETSLVWRREMIRGSYAPLRLNATSPQGPLHVLTFGPNPAHASHVGELPIDETAEIIANGIGFLGTNREYLEELVRRLDTLAVPDTYLGELLAQVRVRCRSNRSKEN